MIFEISVLELVRACLREGGGPQVGEVTCGGLPHLTCKRDHIKMRDCLDRRVAPPKGVTSPTWGPPPPSKQTLRIAMLPKITQKCPWVSHFCFPCTPTSIILTLDR